MQTVQTQKAPSSLEHLLAHYMSGEIADSSWERIMETFDHEGVSSFERMAFARYMSEVVAESQGRELNVPKPDELEELLGEIRA